MSEISFRRAFVSSRRRTIHSHALVRQAKARKRSKLGGKLNREKTAQSQKKQTPTLQAYAEERNSAQRFERKDKRLWVGGIAESAKEYTGPESETHGRSRK
jgi:hypothetical protein